MIKKNPSKLIYITNICDIGGLFAYVSLAQWEAILPPPIIWKEAGITHMFTVKV
jgi:hypothetical protein